MELLQKCLLKKGQTIFFIILGFQPRGRKDFFTPDGWRLIRKPQIVVWGPRPLWTGSNLSVLILQHVLDSLVLLSSINWIKTRISHIVELAFWHKQDVPLALSLSLSSFLEEKRKWRSTNRFGQHLNKVKRGLYWRLPVFVFTFLIVLHHILQDVCLKQQCWRSQAGRLDSVWIGEARIESFCWVPSLLSPHFVEFRLFHKAHPNILLNE